MKKLLIVIVVLAGVAVLAEAPQPAKVPLQVLRIGDICIGSTPCETFAEIGLE
jgi:neutral ceramidase